MSREAGATEQRERRAKRSGEAESDSARARVRCLCISPGRSDRRLRLRELSHVTPDNALYISLLQKKKRGRELQTLRVAFTASAVRAAERSFLVSVSVGVGTEELAVLLTGGLERKPCHEEAA